MYGRESARAFTAALLSVAFLACPDGSTPEPPDGDGTGVACDFDESEGPATAVALALGEEVEGYLCPVQDEDWYRFTTGAGDHLVTVSLTLDAPIAPIEPTYTLHADASGTAGPVTGTPPISEVGGDLELIHCMAPGSYFLVVEDLGQDAQDVRHSYTVTVTSGPDPDPAEPNDEVASSVALSDGVGAVGAIGCRGDEDWYAIDVPAGMLLSVRLDAPVAGFEPAVRVVDGAGTTLVTLENPSGTVQPTALSRLLQPPTTGTWYLVVGDDDDADADPDVTYTVTASLVPDLDPTEPNDTPDEATALSAASCGPSWSAWQDVQGTFGTIGDQDWLRLPLSGCENGLLEVELELDTSSLSDADAWDLQSRLQSSVAVVRGHAPSGCSADSECGSLFQGCSSDFDCAGYFNACVSGSCVGASACLPESVCGANQVVRSYASRQVPGSITGPPPANFVRTAVPLLENQSYIYLRVGDFQSDANHPELLYTLRVRTRQDPDLNEPNNLFVTGLLQSDPRAPHLPEAVAVPVHDCTDGDCCDGTTWVEGSLGYAYDQDWFRYAHPCPGQDCMVRIQYEREGGEAELLFHVYVGSQEFNDALADLPESASHGFEAGALGGLESTDVCMYAYQGHTDDYYVQVRDRVDEVEWAPDQRYRFCVEKILNACSEPPCVDFVEEPSGCGPPL